jgi:hypothetical protein
MGLGVTGLKEGQVTALWVIRRTEVWKAYNGCPKYKFHFFVHWPSLVESTLSWQVTRSFAV